VREAMRGLTVRGRAFLAAGVTAVLCAMLLDQRALIRVGVLLVALPIVTAFVVSRGRYRLALVRTVEPQHTEAGQPARVTLALTNEGWIPTGTLLLEEALPYTLGGRPRFVVERIGRGWRRNLSYSVRSDVRGRFEIGPMTVRVADPFGLVELGRAFRTTTSLTVTPRTVPLTPLEASGGESASGDSRPREFAGGSPEDVTVREYRRGDDLRRVHWASSARVGELMVRREEQPWQARATVFLDNRSEVHRGHGAASSFETAVAMAASVAVHLTRRGFNVRLVTASGDASATSWHSHHGETGVTELLEALALVTLSKRSLVDQAWVGEQGSAGLTVAVLGAIDSTDLAVLRRVRHQAGTAMAIAIDVDGWDHRATSSTEPEQLPAGLTMLTQHGWRGSALRPGDPFDRAWRELGQRASATAYGITTPEAAR